MLPNIASFYRKKSRHVIIRYRLVFVCLLLLLLLLLLLFCLSIIKRVRELVNIGVGCVRFPLPYLMSVKAYVKAGIRGRI